ncbi:MAG: prolyl oligopeptidase family serine peptidase, partial [Planctomycetales bacterium]|nr:prolyl oligopeptidase family serine peptidase [Planctomycetales bacterium]
MAGALSSLQSFWPLLQWSALSLAAVLATGYPAVASADVLTLPETFSVAHSTAGDSFAVEAALASEHAEYRVYRLTYPSPVSTSTPANNTVPADYYLPIGLADGEPPRPAVICLHILNGQFELTRSLCATLAARGVPAVMFKLPYYGERELPGGRAALEQNSQLFIEALPQALADTRRTLDVLASRPEVDDARVGVAGISLGAIVGAAAAGQDARFYRAALMLGGGDLLSVVHHARETRRLSDYLTSLDAVQRRRMEQAILQVDPLTYAASLRTRAQAGHVLMLNAAEDEVIPRAATLALANALGIGERIEWLEGLGHYSAAARLPEMLTRTTDFFAQDLPQGVAEPRSRKVETQNEPAKVLATMLGEVGSLIVKPPAEGRRHLADLEVIYRDENGGSERRGELKLVLGPQNRFRCDATTPWTGAVAIGQDDVPWMASREALFQGSGETRGSDPWSYVDPQAMFRLKMIATALSQ